jgi:hypothetical protein
VDDIAEGSLIFERIAIGCSNPDCKKLTLSVRIGLDDARSDKWAIASGTEIFSEQIIPRGTAKPQPDFVPQPLREDYYEACLIRDLSPKASATLARRCLQGMIRDFCKISKSRLIDEINALIGAVQDGSADRAVTEESVRAIDHVRSLGNIGAHMEKDIGAIVSVDPGEAQAMIELIEMLFDEWYGERRRRQQRLDRVASIKTEKDMVRGSASSAGSAPIPAETPADP